MYDFRHKNRPLSSSSQLNDLSATAGASKGHQIIGNFRGEYLMK